MTDEKIDARLGALLRGSERAPDEAFITRIERAVRAEQVLEAQRRATWRRFGSEAAAAAAIAVAFVLLGRAAPAAGEIDITSFGPATAAALILLFWLAVGMRPFATGQ